MAQPTKVQAVLTARPGREAELEALLRSMLGPSRNEAGNRRYDLWRDPEHAGRFVLDELYVDGAAVVLHRATDHFKHYLSVIGDLAERQAHVVTPVDVAGLD